MDNAHELAVVKAEDDRTEIVKVHFMSQSAAPVKKNDGTNTLPFEDRGSGFEQCNALIPPHNPDTLCMLLSTLSK